MSTASGRYHARLRSWQRAMDLVVVCYALARRLPDVERYGLASQLRRASISVPANIAEGYGRVHRGEYVHHLSIARGSTAEIQTLLEICERLKYASPADLDPAREHAHIVAPLLARQIMSLR